jgi:hypothetical protein
MPMYLEGGEWRVGLVLPSALVGFISKAGETLPFILKTITCI